MNELAEIVTQLRELGSKDFQDKIAARAADAIRMQLLKTLDAGQTPDGRPWALRKKDGKRAYADASAKLTVKAHGDLIRATITGPEVYGHFGWGDTKPRQMLPDAGAGVPKEIEKAITDAAREVLAEVTK